MTIIQAGSLNTTALLVPNAYIQIQPPAQQFLNGVPTNVLGIVGTATWGPANSPTTVGNLSQYTAIFGPIQARKYDAGTQVATAVLQGASNFRIVRVTDGSDTFASVVVQSNCITFTSKYTGSFGNSIIVTVSAGTQVGTFKVVVAAPGLVAEAFDNIGFGLAGNALWLAIANAINNGSTALRGPSAIVTATAGAGTAAPAVPTTYNFSGGTDGAASVTGPTLLGQDVVPRQGMYALRSTGCSVALLADCDTSTTWSTQIAYGLSEGTYMIMTGPAGDNIANAAAVKASAGIDSYAAKLCFGDWVYWLDTVNNVLRLVSPQGFFGGLLTSFAPNQSSLNKQMLGIAGTQKSYANQVYASADLQNLAIAGIDVIANPCPGGAYFGANFGHNTSSNALIHSDAYTRMTNYIAATLNAGVGQFIGDPQAANAIGQGGTPSAQLLATLGAFFDNLQEQGLIGAPGGAIAYSVQVNAANNPPSRVALGYLQADVQVQYQSIIEFLLVNIQGGASVQIQSVGVQPNPV